MFHALISENKFDAVVKTLKKENPPDLSKYQSFCALDNENEAFLADSEIKIDYQIINDKDVYIDF